MKKIGYIIFLLPLVLASCLKDKTINSDGLNKTGALVEIQYAGIDFFSNSAVLASDTISESFVVNYASTTTLASDLTITVGLNDSARMAYNSGGYGLTYQKLPDSAYSIATKTGVIKAGTREVTFTVTFYPKKFDPTINYMAAIGILNAQGQVISGNFGSILYHFIGNPIAGPYTREWIRYNTATITGTPAFDQTAAVVFAPVDPTTIRVSSGTGVAYLVTFTNTGGVLSNFNVNFPSDANDAGSAAYNGISITSGPTIVLADPINKKYTFNFTYLNSAGAARNITDKFTK